MKTHQLAAKFPNTSSKKPALKKGGQKTSLQRQGVAPSSPNPALQMQGAALSAIPVQRIAISQTGGNALPNGLRRGVEALSGVSMAGVHVHRNSSLPAQMQAHATAQGNHIHLASGQDRHLPHEAWHIAQQRQGRVKPTAQMAGVALNTDRRLEVEADRMGARAASMSTADAAPVQRMPVSGAGSAPMQLLNWTAHVAPSPTVVKDNNGHVVANVRESNGVEAKVEPGDSQYGSGTTDAVRKISQMMQQGFGGYWVAGHMLNDNLGGPGNDQDNITAFTKTDNSHHLHGLEKKAKEEVNGNGNTIAYKTMVAERANFKCSHGTVSNIATRLIGGYKIIPPSAKYSTPNKTMDIQIGPETLGFKKMNAKGQ